jgi:hypothetical protein
MCEHLYARRRKEEEQNLRGETHWRERCASLAKAEAAPEEIRE